MTTKMKGGAAAVLLLAVLGCGKSEPSAVTAGCSKDSDCKGDRICHAGECVEPQAIKAAASSAAPVASAEKAAVDKQAPDKPLVQTGPRGIVPQEQVLVDEEIALPTSGPQFRKFKMASRKPVQFTVDPVKNADKGFSLYLMPSADVVRFIEQKYQFAPGVPGFEASSVRSLKRTETLAAGDWTLMLWNTQNLLRAAVVKVKIVADPQP